MTESTEMEDNKALSETLPSPNNPRARRLRSLVWNDFTKKQKADGNYEAICNHCSKKFTANSRSGTTHLRNHLNFCLSVRVDGRKRGRKRQATLKFAGTNNDEKYGHVVSQFDQELSRQDLSRMIILHEYPLEIVQHVGFQTFIKNLQPRFKLVSGEIIKEDCMRIYENGRNRLSELLERLRCRVSLTMDRWGMSDGAEYMCLTCHLVDDEWKLQKKMLNLVHFGAPPTAEDICEGIIEKLHDWKISRKLSCMVLDQCGDDQAAAADLLLKFFQATDSLHLNGDLFHFHDCVHALHVIAQDALAAQVGDICDRLRSCVIFVKSSPEKLKRFQNAAILSDAPKKPLVLDVNANWRSTYLMIATACEFQNAFKNLAEYDSDFSFPLSDAEWDEVKSVKECLETFDHMIKKFAGIRKPTANLYFIDICGILLLLKSWSVSSVPITVKLASQMLKDFEQYWDANITVLAIASILDPRYKMKSVEYFFKNIYNGDYEAKVKIESICNSLRNLYSEYAVHSARTESDQALLCYTSDTSACAGEECGASGGSQTSSHITLSDTRKGLDQYLQQTLSIQSIKSDLDLYLEEAVYICKDGPDDSFNVLAWWKLNAAKYPVLSLVARDLLAVPLGNVTLRLEDRSLSQYFSSLDPVTLQGMVCAQDWLRDETEANLEEDAFLGPNIAEKL